MEEQIQEVNSSGSIKDTLPRNKKALVTWAVFLVLVSVLSGMISFFPANTRLAFILIRAGQLLAFLITGMLYTRALYKNASSQPDKTIADNWLYILLLAAVIGALLFALYYLRGRWMPMVIAGSTCAFIIPFTVALAWHFYSNMYKKAAGTGQAEPMEEDVKQLQAESAAPMEEEARKEATSKEAARKKEELSRKEAIQQAAREQAAQEKLKKQQEETRQKQIALQEQIRQKEARESAIRKQEEEKAREAARKKEALRLQEARENELKKQQEEARLKEAALQEEIRQKTIRENELRKQQEAERARENERKKEALRLQEFRENELKKQQEEARLKEAAFQEEMRQKEARENERKKEALRLQEARENELKQQQEEARLKEAARLEEMRQKEAREKERREKQEEARLKEAARRRMEAETAREEEAGRKTALVTNMENAITAPAETGLISNDKDAGRKGKVWFYTEPDTEQQPVLFLNSVVFYLQLSVKSTGEEEVFSSSAPVEMKLGDFFNHFIDVKKRSKKPGFDLLDEQQQFYGWKFYTRGFIKFTTRELDPTASLQKNRLKEASIIIAKRVF